MHYRQAANSARIKVMKSIARFKKEANNWRLHTQNYIGSLGYYLIFLSLVFMAIRLYMQVSQYILYVQSDQDTVYGGSTTASASSLGLFESILAYTLVAVMAAVTIGVMIAIPYVVGYFSAKLVRLLMSMTSTSISLRGLFNFKYSYAIIAMVAVLLMIYRYDQDVNGNWYSFLLIIMNFAAIVLFWVQYLLVKLWNIKAKDTL